jgi:hypothetical protein
MHESRYINSDYPVIAKQWEPLAATKKQPLIESNNMKLIVVTVSILIFSFSCLSQTNAKVTDKVRLSKWSSEACDKTYDPYRLKTRITNIEYTDTTMVFTVNFSENCCATFKPAINFYKNKLVLLPYRKYTGGFCGCNCCFTIKYEISGLAGKKYQLYFKEEEITLSNNYYDTVKPSFQFYEGKKINSTNKYGFKEGIWITFFENGNVEVVSKYPDQSLYYDLDPIWSKGYYPSGRLSFYNRKDTSESWFEDQEMKSQFIEYKAGDTTFKKGFSKFNNRVLREEYFEKYYPTVFKSEFDPEYKEEGGIFETVYKREYFESGKPKFIFGRDTSFSWFETGLLEFKQYKSGRMEFDTSGRVTEQLFSWMQKGSKSSGDLNNSLYVYFYPNGNVREIELVRDEPTRNGLAPGVRYNWKWDKNLNLMESPEKWKEAFPWNRFTEIKLPPKMYKGLENYPKTTTNSR